MFTTIKLETHNFSSKFRYVSQKYEIGKVHRFEKYVFFDKLLKSLKFQMLVVKTILYIWVHNSTYHETDI